VAACEQIQYLGTLLSGGLSATDQASLESHVDTCRECQAKLETILSKKDPVSQLERTSEWNKDVVDRIAQRLNSHDEVAPTLTGGSLPTAMNAEGIPEQFGRYRILKTLGKGGMGAVYLAEDAELDRKVAIKIPFIGDDQEILDRFRREARSVAQIQHPNICPVYDVSQFQGKPFMTMAFIEGKSLSAYIQPGKPIAVEQVVKLVQILANALAFAHRAGIIHRDLKPANIMLDSRGQPIIMDFGLAFREGKDDTQITKTGQIMGTPNYMPPEQVAGKSELMGAGCDIYSLGVILYQLLTGSVPFQGDLLAVLSQIALEKPQPPSATRPELSLELDAICLKALEKNPQDRFQSMEEFASALAGCSNTENPTSIMSFAADSAFHQNVSNDLAKSAVNQRATAKSIAKGSRGSGGAISSKAIAICGGGALLLLLGVILYFQFGGKTLKVVVHDPEMNVALKNHAITITGENQEKITLKPGAETITVKRGDFQFETTNLTLSKGEQVTIEIDYLDGKPQITKNGKPLSVSPVTTVESGVPVVPTTPTPDSPTTDSTKKFEVALNGGLRINASAKQFPVAKDVAIDPTKPCTIEAWMTPEMARGNFHSLINMGNMNIGIWNHQDWQVGINSKKQYLRGSVAGTYTPNQRVHVALVRDAKTIRIFIDGIESERSLQTFAGGKSWRDVNEFEEPQTAPEKRLSLGNGYQNMVGIYHALRISQMVRYDANFDPPLTLKADENTIALYLFNEETGQQFRDSSGNDLHGVIGDAKWVNADENAE